MTIKQSRKSKEEVVSWPDVGGKVRSANVRVILGDGQEGKRFRQGKVLLCKE